MGNALYKLAAPFRWLVCWYLRPKIEYLERMIDSTHDNADVQRDGLSPDYWKGKRHGLKVALKFLFNRDAGGWE